MNKIEAQLVDSSRIIADIVVANIGNDQELFDEAVSLMLRDTYPLSMRAARVIQLVAVKHPDLLRSNVDKFVKCLQTSKVDGVKRSVLKILSETPVYIGEELFGELADVSFQLAEDPKEAIAIRAFAIDILLKVVKKYPEVKPELRAILESMLPECSVGLKTKCRKILKKLGY
jgi:hypothetical protein